MIKNNYFLFSLCFGFFVFKVISIYLTKFDLFGDEAQYWLWSQNIDLGYYSKPPLLSWIIASICLIFGNSIFVIKLISVFMYCLSAIIIFFITQRLYMNNNLAFLTSLTFFLMPAVSFSSFFISTDVFLIFFWSLALLQILIIKDFPTRLNFILLGIFIGLAFLAKYAAVYFFICIFLLFFEKNMKNILLKNKLSFCIFIITFAIIITPNIIWNFNNDWTTFGHTIDNAALSRVNFDFIKGLSFFISQIVMIGPVLFLFFIFIISKKINFNFKTKFLLIFSLPIFFIVLIEGFLVRANANWAAVSLVAFLILFVQEIYKINKKILIINNTINYIFGISFFLLIATNTSLKPFDRISGITSFSNYIAKSGSEKTIKNIVISDRMLFSGVSYALRKSNLKFFTTHTPNSKISHHFQLTNAMPSYHNKNFIYIGYIEQLEYLKNKHNINLLKIKNVKFNKKPIKIYEVTF